MTTSKLFCRVHVNSTTMMVSIAEGPRMWCGLGGISIVGVTRLQSTCDSSSKGGFYWLRSSAQEKGLGSDNGYGLNMVVWGIWVWPILQVARITRLLITSIPSFWVENKAYISLEETGWSVCLTSLVSLVLSWRMDLVPSTPCQMPKVSVELWSLTWFLNDVRIVTAMDGLLGENSEFEEKNA